MKSNLITMCLLLITAVISAFSYIKNLDDSNILSYTVDTKKQDLQLYWKDDNGKIFNSINNLKYYLENKKQTLVFAMNAGMYQADYAPQGLFIQKNKIIKSLDTSNGKGNFYLQPNGVFYLTNNNEAYVCSTRELKNTTHIKFATQSGPMLLINGEIHPAFKNGSSNLNIRNGVGILPNKKVIFALSKTEINFYDFANYFKKLGCKNALYLDGFVSRTYLPEKKWIQTDGNFGVIIGVTRTEN